MNKTHIALFSIAILTFAFFVFAEEPKPKSAPHPCEASKEFRQFDFWIGEWNVYQKNKLAGKSKIELILDGCVILENWTGAGGYSGKSFNLYNPAIHKWEQIWVDNQAGVLKFQGEFVNGELRYTGTTHLEDGSIQLERLTFSPLPKKEVRQLWEQSKDNGKTWTVAFDGLYKRAAKE